MRGKQVKRRNSEGTQDGFLAKRVLILAPSFPPAELAGGPPRTLEAMIQLSQPKVRARVMVQTSAYDLGNRMDVESDRQTTRNDVAVYYASGGPIAQMAAIWKTRSTPTEVVYINSLLHPVFSIAPMIMHRLGAWRGSIMALAPRGELEDGALAQKTWKKRFFIKAARIIGLHQNAVWHASSAKERESIRRHFTGAKVIVRMNESLLPTKPDLSPRPKGRAIRVAFLGRIAPNKGLDTLLAAAAQVSHPLTIDVYGPAQVQWYVERCHSLAAQVRLPVTVSFKGALVHDLAVSTLASYDALALPTHGENFGHAIAEALAAGCPPMIPATTPWTEAVTAIGTLVDPNDIPSWTRALEKLGSADLLELEALRQRTIEQYSIWRAREQSAPTTLDLLSSSN